MKRRVTAIMLLLMIVFSCTVSAQEVNMSDSGVSLVIPDEYTVITTSKLSKNKDFIEKLGHTTDSFKRSMNDSNIIVYAATSTNQRQIQVRLWESQFSTLTADLGTLDDEALANVITTIGQEISGDNQLLASEQITKGDAKFFKFVVGVAAERPFCYIQYLTVMNKKFYSLVYYNDSATITAEQQAEAATVFNTFSIKKEKSGGLFNSNTVFQIVIIGVVIAAAVALVIFIIMTFYKDIKSRGNAPETIPYRIKMRRK